MSIESQIDAAAAKVEREMAKRLLRAATFFQVQHMNRVSRPNVKIGRKWVDNSKPGEYPRLRTGHGRAGVVMDASSIDDVVANGMRIRIGQSQASWYMPFLELERDRLGYIKSAEELIAMVMALVKGTA